MVGLKISIYLSIVKEEIEICVCVVICGIHLCMTSTLAAGLPISSVAQEPYASEQIYRLVLSHDLHHRAVHEDKVLNQDFMAFIAALISLCIVYTLHARFI